MDRREFLKGIVAVGIAAPAIVSLANIMPVRNRLWTLEEVLEEARAKPNWSPLYHSPEWERMRERLAHLHFTDEINRERIRVNYYSGRT